MSIVNLGTRIYLLKAVFLRVQNTEGLETPASLHWQGHPASTATPLDLLPCIRGGARIYTIKKGKNFVFRAKARLYTNKPQDYFSGKPHETPLLSVSPPSTFL